jgi:hypothetical protein
MLIRNYYFWYWSNWLIDQKWLNRNIINNNEVIFCRRDFAYIMPTSRIFLFTKKKEILKNTKPIKLFQDNCEEKNIQYFRNFLQVLQAFKRRFRYQSILYNNIFLILGSIIWHRTGKSSLKEIASYWFTSIFISTPT